MNREELLSEALEVVTRHRQSQYGTPEDNFKVISQFWNTYLKRAFALQDESGFELRPHDVAAMMCLLKVARMLNNPGNPDNWLDLAGYAACGSEVATRDETQSEKSVSQQWEAQIPVTVIRDEERQEQPHTEFDDLLRSAVDPVHTETQKPATPQLPVFDPDLELQKFRKQDQALRAFRQKVDKRTILTPEEARARKQPLTGNLPVSEPKPESKPESAWRFDVSKKHYYHVVDTDGKPNSYRWYLFTRSEDGGLEDVVYVVPYTYQTKEAAYQAAKTFCMGNCIPAEKAE